VSSVLACNCGKGRAMDLSRHLATIDLRTYGKDGARKRTRTSTTLRSLAPEASASANSAIRAQARVHRFTVTPEMCHPDPAGVTHIKAFSFCPPVPPLSTQRIRTRVLRPAKS
jgi:hypothetical protein